MLITFPSLCLCDFYYENFITVPGYVGPNFFPDLNLGSKLTCQESADIDDANIDFYNVELPQKCDKVDPYRKRINETDPLTAD